MNASSAPERVSAAVLLVGDELLSGRTQDVNLQTIAKFVGPLGVQIQEVRIVPDIPERIIEAVNAVRAAYDYVFTTGGIGPTHDDKTADCIAAAFGVGIGVRDDARAILAAHYKGDENLSDARLRMARIPDGALLIANPVSKAPGFQMGNVFVMAGVPSIMRGMLEDVGPRLRGGAVFKSKTVRGLGLRESLLADALGVLELNSPGVTFGSYPFFSGDIGGVNLVARSADPEALARAGEAMAQIIRDCGIEPEFVDEAA